VTELLIRRLAIFLGEKTLYLWKIYSNLAGFFKTVKALLKPLRRFKIIT